MTFSIVARDDKIGDLGVAVSSHWFSVGSIVPWGRSGVGVVATQSVPEISYGPLGLELMAGGKTSQQALDSLLQSDPKSSIRQVAILARHGPAATHTGSECAPAAGHLEGKNYSCQGNILSNSLVWEKMAETFEMKQKEKNLSLADRLVTVLETGQHAGGDLRGRQSAALLIVSGKMYPNYWSGRLVDIRVEDSVDPITELRRLLRLHDSYALLSKGRRLLSKRRYDNALSELEKAYELSNGNDEITYWFAVGLAQSGFERKGASVVRKIKERNRWLAVTRSLQSSGQVPPGFEDLFH
jgi:uncharacterized Ntn-hydrolase superfamily protein